MTPQPPTASQPKPKVRYLGRTSYTVESRTRPGHVHHVDTYRLTCTCEAGRFGKRCWALVAALGYEDWRRASRPKPRRPAPARPASPPSRKPSTLSFAQMDERL